jgi:hypothetical protein
VIATTIREAYANDPDSIRSQDDAGLTPIHMAASSFNLHAIRTLLDMGVSDQLQSRHNSEGTTPLENSEISLLSDRQIRNTFRIRPLSDAEGAEQKIKLLCVATMKRAMGLTEMNQITDEGYAEQRKWGCTCGSCAGGFLSPRMIFRLGGKTSFVIHQSWTSTQTHLSQDIAESAAQQLSQTLDYEKFQPGQPLPKKDWGICSVLEFLPTKLHRSVTKTFLRRISRNFQHDFLRPRPSPSRYFACSLPFYGR